MKKRLGIVIMSLLIILSVAGCGMESSSTVVVQNESESAEPITYTAMMYDNRGNNFLNFEGNSFTISPNKVEQYGYDHDGSWISYYETSSVVTINVDGNYIQTCGSTVIFKDTRLEMLEIPDEIDTREASNTDGYTVTEDNQTLDSYFELRSWWYDIEEQGQHGEKVILIQSQDGYNIGAFVGSDITWEVAAKLPKTTLIMIDGLPLYIHRCNFTIIDSELLENSF